MAKQNDTWVYQKENGYWEYRFVVRIDGKRVCRKKCTDENGNKFRTKREAVAAREAAIVALRIEKTTKPKPARRLVKEVFEEFCAEGRKDRAYGTIRKQDSIWDNHLRDRFGNRYVDEISSADVVDYLSELYYVEGKAFKYVESFLKMFYLIFGQAYSRNYLDVDTYNNYADGTGHYSVVQTMVRSGASRNQQGNRETLFPLESNAVRKAGRVCHL